jgi:hypothetical protein
MISETKAAAIRRVSAAPIAMRLVPGTLKDYTLVMSAAAPRARVTGVPELVMTTVLRCASEFFGFRFPASWSSTRTGMTSPDRLIDHGAQSSFSTSPVKN